MRPTEEQQKSNHRTLLHLYKSHYKPGEAVVFSGLSYATVTRYYQAFKLSNTPKYSRDVFKEMANAS